MSKLAVRLGAPLALLLLPGLLVLIVPMLLGTAPRARALTSLPQGFVQDAPIRGLVQPIAFDWTTDGRLFVGQKNGQLRLVKSGVVQTTPVLTLTVDTHSERGLLGVALDPKFSSRPYIYLFYTAAGSLYLDGAPKNRVSRFTVTGDAVDSGSELILVDDIPSDVGNHNGGDLHFGPDGMLYVSTGDGGLARNGHSQNLDSLGGKILRIDPLTGQGLADNPFAGPNAGEDRKRVSVDPLFIGGVLLGP